MRPAALDVALDSDVSPSAAAKLFGAHGAASNAPEAAPVTHGLAAQAAVNAERSRIGSILRAPEAADRAAAAQALALDSNVTLQQARALLSRLPKATARTAALFGPGGYRTIEQRSRRNTEANSARATDDERPGPRGKPGTHGKKSVDRAEPGQRLLAAPPVPKNPISKEMSPMSDQGFFTGDAFSVVRLTQALNDLAYVPGRLEARSASFRPISSPRPRSRSSGRATCS